MVMTKKIFSVSVVVLLVACEQSPTAPTKEWPVLNPPTAHMKVGDRLTFTLNGVGETSHCPILMANRPWDGPDPDFFLSVERTGPEQWSVTMTRNPQEVHRGGAVSDPFEVLFMVLAGHGQCSRRPVGNSAGEAKIYVHQ
jgi:hypothetical protein